MTTTDILDEAAITVFLATEVDGEPVEPMLDCINTRFLDPEPGDLIYDDEAFAAVFFPEDPGVPAPWAACFMAD